MKKILLVSAGALLLASSCSTYTATGSYMGAILGSAIGGISGGPRGSDIGTIVGMAGGAAVGGAIEAGAQKKRQQDIERRRSERAAGTQEAGKAGAADESGFNPQNSGDDVLYGDFGLPEVPASVLEGTATEAAARSGIKVRKARFASEDNRSIRAGEVCKITFEIMNMSDRPVYNIMPSVAETTGNKHIYISQGIRVESIHPGKGVRYTAMIKADSRLKNGTACFSISVTHNGKPVDTNIADIQVATRR